MQREKPWKTERELHLYLQSFRHICKHFYRTPRLLITLHPHIIKAINNLITLLATASGPTEDIKHIISCLICSIFAHFIKVVTSKVTLHCIFIIVNKTVKPLFDPVQNENCQSDRNNHLHKYIVRPSLTASVHELPFFLVLPQRF